MNDNQGMERSDVFPDFSVSIEEADKRVKTLQQYVREYMTEGEDYGVIPGATKPTLFKPGAEKLNAIFGLAPIVEVVHRIENWERGFLSYETKVTLINKRTRQIEAEGIGSCNSKERRYARQDAPSIANTILKMSKKRALIDATLSATCAWGVFSQDIADSDDTDETPAHQVRSGSTQREGTRPQQQSAPTSTAASTLAEPETEPVSNEQRNIANGNLHLLTDAQHRAILAIASRVFGRPANAEDFKPFVEKSIDQLTKGEASTLIDKLRYRLAEQQPQSASSREGRAPR